MKRQEIVVGLGVMSLLLLLAAGCGGGGGGGNGGGGSGGGNTVTATITGAAFVAVQDGKTGAWQRLSGSGPDYNFTVNSADGRYSIAWVCEGDKPRVNIIHATTAETRTIAASCATPPSTISVAGTVQGLGSGQGALVAIGSSPQTVPSNGGAFLLSVVPGAYDLIAVRFNTSGLVPNKVWLERNRTFSKDTSGLLIDFNQVDGSTVRVFDVSAGNLSISGADVGETVVTQVALQSSGRSSLIALGNATSVNYPIFPPGVLTAGESVRFWIETDRGRGQISAVSSVPSSLSITLPPPFDSPSFSFTSAGALSFSVNWSAYAESPVRGYLFTLGSDQQQRTWRIFISAGWLGGDMQYTTPVLSGLSGWNSTAWDFVRGRPVDANFRALVSSNAVQQLLDLERTGVAPSGFQLRFATRSVTLTP